MPNRVKVAAALASIDQKEIVEATGLVQPYVSDVFRGRFERITVDNARKFAEFFGCTIEDLFPAREAVAS
jgi:transcriptional regulator with XRE-family HTH domain